MTDFDNELNAALSGDEPVSDEDKFGHLCQYCDGATEEECLNCATSVCDECQSLVAIAAPPHYKDAKDGRIYMGFCSTHCAMMYAKIRSHQYIWSNTMVTDDDGKPKMWTYPANCDEELDCALSGNEPVSDNDEFAEPLWCWGCNHIFSDHDLFACECGATFCERCLDRHTIMDDDGNIVSCSDCPQT